MALYALISPTMSSPSAHSDVPSSAEIDAIAELVRGPAWEAAGERLSSALQRWPRHRRLRLVQAEWLERGGDVACAEACLRELLQDAPESPAAACRLVNLLLVRQQPDEARAVFARHVWQDQVPEVQAVALLNRVVAATPGAGARDSLLTGLLRDTPRDRFVLVKLAALRFRENDKVEAMRLFDAANRLGPVPDSSHILHLDLLIVHWRLDDALALARELMARHPERRDIVSKAIQVCELRHRGDELVPILRDAMRRWPDDWLLLARYNRSRCRQAIDRELFDDLSAHEAAAGRDDRWALEYALACLRHCEHDRAVAVLSRLAPTGPVADLALPLQRLFASRPRSAWVNSRDISNDRAHDLQVRRVPHAQATVLVFAGAGTGGLGLLPCAHLDTLLREHSVQVVYLRDQRGRGFVQGVASLGADEAATVRGLRALAAELDAGPIITLGGSIGALAAVRFGALLPAAAAISCSGPLHLDPVANERDDQVRYRSAMLSMLNKTGRVDTDYITLIAQSPALRVYHNYGTGHVQDAATAERLRPLSNVTLLPVECPDHFAVTHLMADGSFDALLRRVVADCVRSSAAGGGAA
jgi:tetratricopeptide (TPR) repeat protein